MKLDIITDRLLLRPVCASDAESLYAMCADRETMKFWSEPPMTDISQAQEKLINSQKAQSSGTAMILAVVIKESHDMIGQISLFNIHEASARAEVGYLLNRHHWRKGIMYEAMYAFVNGCFNEINLRRLEADIDPKNMASAALLRRLGFTKEGCLKQRWVVGGNITDSDVYGLLKTDFS